MKGCTTFGKIDKNLVYSVDVNEEGPYDYCMSTYQFDSNLTEIGIFTSSLFDYKIFLEAIINTKNPISEFFNFE